MSYSTEPATISSTDTYSSNKVINEGLTDMQVRIFCALFVLFACAALIIGGKTLHLISKFNYNNNRPICPSVSSLLVASLVMGVFVELVKLLIHITPDTFEPWCKAQQYFSDLATIAGILSLALIMWDVRVKMQYNSSGNAHWTSSHYRTTHVVVIWLVSAILAVRIPFLKGVSGAPGNTEIVACLYRHRNGETLITADLITSAVILLMIALIIGMVQWYLANKGVSQQSAYYQSELRMSMGFLFIAVATKLPLHTFLIMSYTEQRSGTDFGVVLNSLELVMYAQGWLMPIVVLIFNRDLRMEFRCCGQRSITQSRSNGNGNIQINQVDDGGGRTSMQSRGTKSLRSQNSPLPILHI